MHQKSSAAPTYAGKQLPWTFSEDNLLRQIYSHYQSAEVARVLARSLSSVRHRALVLGLSKRESSDDGALSAEVGHASTTETASDRENVIAKTIAGCDYRRGIITRCGGVTRHIMCG